MREGDLLGKVTDPITNIRKLILSPLSGRVIGMAVNQVVLPGFAAFHIGIDPSSPEGRQSISGDENTASELPQDNDEEEAEASFDEYD